MKKQYAVITGAGTGLGRAYAFELARREINLILISLPHEGLDRTTQQLREFGIDVRCYETDLTSHQHVADVAQWINSGFEVALLINNPDAGDLKRLRDAGPEHLNTNVQLNLMSISLLTRALLPNLIRQRKAYILNVSDTGAFVPTGFKRFYKPSVASIHHFSRSLYYELQNTSVFVSVVNPGPIKKTGDLPGRGILERLWGLTPERVAGISIRRLFRREAVILPGPGSVVNWIWRKMVSFRSRLPRSPMAAV